MRQCCSAVGLEEATLPRDRSSAAPSDGKRQVRPLRATLARCGGTEERSRHSLSESTVPLPGVPVRVVPKTRAAHKPHTRAGGEGTS